MAAAGMPPPEDDVRHVPLLTASTRRRWRADDRPDRPAELNSAVLSVVQMVNTMLGSGILSFPYAFSQTGLVLGLALLVFFETATYLTNLMNLETGVAVGMATGDMSEIVETATRSTTWRRYLDLAVAVEAFGSLLSYNNAMGNLGASVLKPTRPPDAGLNTYPGVIVICTLMLSPFCFLRAFGEVAPVSVASYALIATTTLCIAGAGLNAGRAIPWAPQSFVGSVAVIGNFVFATSNQYACHEMYASMRATDRPGVTRVILVTSVIGGCTLGTMALGGLAAIGERRISANVLDGLPEGALRTTLSLFTIVHFMCYIPNDFIIMRLFGCRFFDVNPLQIPTARYVVLTGILIAVPAAAMAAIPRDDVVGVFELVIALTGTIPIVFAVMLTPSMAFKRGVLDKQASSSSSSSSSRDPEAPPGGPTTNPVHRVDAPQPAVSGEAAADKAATNGAPADADKPPGAASATAATTASLAPFLRRHPWITYATIVVSVFIMVVATVVTVYQFAVDCLDKSCSEFGNRRRRF